MALIGLLFIVFLALAFFLWFYSNSDDYPNVQKIWLYVFGLLHDQSTYIKQHNNWDKLIFK